MTNQRHHRLPRFVTTPQGSVGLGLLLIVLFLGLVGPLLAPHAADKTIGAAGAGPSSLAPLGTDFLGRDVLSRVLHGGASVLLFATGATVLAFVIGVALGLICGYNRGRVDALLMRSVDVMLAFPALLVLLVLVTGLGTSAFVLILGVVLVQLPGIARVVRSATLQVATREYVEASLARGESTGSILMRDLLPNIVPVVMSDFGVRYGFSVILIASMNFLGVGLQPPSADWGLMIAENQTFITINPWAVLAPAITLGTLTIAVNLVSDAYARSLDPSTARAPIRTARRRLRESVVIRHVKSALLHLSSASPHDPTLGRGHRHGAGRPERSQRGDQVAAVTDDPHDASILEATDLSVRALGGHEILHSVSLSLAPAEVLGIVGESGAGKTTLALALLGFALPGAEVTSGRLILGDQVLDPRDWRSLSQVRGRRISYVHQSPATALNPSLRVEKAIQDMLEAHGGVGTPADALTSVGLSGAPDFRRRYPHQLSGGQQQRVCVAIALACRPPVVVLDEPTTGLDVVSQSLIIRELHRLRQDLGIAMIYVSHNLAVVAQLADRIAVMYDGRVVEFGPTKTVLTRPQHPYTCGLLDSLPDHLSVKTIFSMDGRPPTPGTQGRGCAFAPRCPLQTSECDDAIPELIEVAGAHRARCIHVDRVGQLRRPKEYVRGPASPRYLDVVLTVRDLRAEYKGRGRAKVPGVENVSFTLGAGECVALVGESASGKTTVARTIVGLHGRSSGEVELGGRRLSTLARNRGVRDRGAIQLIFQNPRSALNPHQTVTAAIARPAVLLRGMAASSAAHEVQKLLEQVRLPVDVADRYPSELSGGEAQRVAVARALAAQPLVLICDEITSALDVSVQAAVLELLGDLRRTLGLSILFITHDLGVVATIADRVLVLDRGSVCEEGAVQDILANPKHPYTKQLLDAAPSISAIRAAWAEIDERPEDFIDADGVRV